MADEHVENQLGRYERWTHLSVRLRGGFVPIIPETKQVLQAWKAQIEQLGELCRQGRIRGWRAPLQLITAYRQDPLFRQNWNSIVEQMVKDNGGKLTLATSGLIIGSVLGGVGLAGAWGAIGVPLAIILVPIGWLVGTDVDHWKSQNAEPAELQSRLEVLESALKDTQERLEMLENALVQTQEQLAQSQLVASRRYRAIVRTTSTSVAATLAFITWVPWLMHRVEWWFPFGLSLFIVAAAVGCYRSLV